MKEESGRRSCEKGQVLKPPFKEFKYNIKHLKMLPAITIVWDSQDQFSQSFPSRYVVEYFPEYGRHMDMDMVDFIDLNAVIL